MVEIGMELNFLCIYIFLSFLLLDMDLCEMGTQVQQMVMHNRWLFPAIPLPVVQCRTLLSRFLGCCRSAVRHCVEYDTNHYQSTSKERVKNQYTWLPL